MPKQDYNKVIITVIVISIFAYLFIDLEKLKNIASLIIPSLEIPDDEISPVEIENPWGHDDDESTCTACCSYRDANGRMQTNCGTGKCVRLTGLCSASCGTC